MSTHRHIASSIVFSSIVLFFAACSSPADAPIAAPDAPPPRAPLDPSGTFLVRSVYSLAAAPPQIAPLLAELSAATDDADDPSAYLVDLIVAELPEGTPRTIASALAPYVAWYINDKIAMYAPDFVPGVRAMVAGAERIATRFGTMEEMRIVSDPASKSRLAASDDSPDIGASNDDRGASDDDRRASDDDRRASDDDRRASDDHRRASDDDCRASNDDVAHASTLPPRSAHVRRTIVGARFDDMVFAFAEVGLPDAGAEANVVVETFDNDRVPDQITIATHEVSVPYAAWFRVGFDRAVIPSVVPGATDLAGALRGLVHCPRLGALIADALEVGSPSLYAQACSIGLGAGARKIYERFPSASDSQLYRFVLAGSATALDSDADGIMDALADGSWAGRLDGTPIGAAVFEGVSR